MVHRFSEEYEGRVDVGDALLASVRGTGGALTGSMLTTVTGIGVLVLAITPLLGQFGFLIGISVLYSYLASLLVLPSTILVWDRYWNARGGRLRSTAAQLPAAPDQFTQGPPESGEDEYV
jgi:predicted RND superfamily exporter protein